MSRVMVYMRNATLWKAWNAFQKIVSRQLYKRERMKIAVAFFLRSTVAAAWNTWKVHLARKSFKCTRMQDARDFCIKNKLSIAWEAWTDDVSGRKKKQELLGQCVKFMISHVSTATLEPLG